MKVVTQVLMALMVMVFARPVHSMPYETDGDVMRDPLPSIGQARGQYTYITYNLAERQGSNAAFLETSSRNSGRNRGYRMGILKWQTAIEMIPVKLYCLPHPGSHDQPCPKGYQPSAGRFDISIPFNLLARWDGFSAVEGSSSSPFFSHDYSPAVHLNWQTPWFNELWIRTVVRHDSNGLDRGSRSWNRWGAGFNYVLAEHRLGRVIVDFWAWRHFKSARSKSELGGRRIHEFYGNWEASITTDLKFTDVLDFNLRVTGRQNAVIGETGWRFLSRGKATGRGNVAGADIFAQAHHGRGHDLRSAHLRNTTLWAGFRFDFGYLLGN